MLGKKEIGTITDTKEKRVSSLEKIALAVGIPEKFLKYHRFMVGIQSFVVDVIRKCGIESLRNLYYRDRFDLKSWWDIELDDSVIDKIVQEIKSKYNVILSREQENSWLKENSPYIGKEVNSYSGIYVDDETKTVYFQSISRIGNNLTASGTSTGTTKVELIGDIMRSSTFGVSYFENLDVNYSYYNICDIDLNNKIVDSQYYSYDSNGKQTAASVLENGRFVYKEVMKVEDCLKETIPPQKR